MIKSLKLNGIFLSLIILLMSCTPAIKPTKDLRKKEVEKTHSLNLDVYKPEFVFPGTTVLVNSTNPKSPYIVEIDMEGKVLWYYQIPKSILKGCEISKGPDIEWLPDENHFLFVLHTNQ